MEVALHELVAGPDHGTWRRKNLRLRAARVCAGVKFKPQIVARAWSVLPRSGAQRSTRIHLDLLVQILQAHRR